MNKTIKEFINKNNAVYSGMFIENAKLNLKPYTLPSYEENSDSYLDKEKCVLVSLGSSCGGAYCVMKNANAISEKGDYRVGVDEYFNSSAVTVKFTFFGIPACTRISVYSDKIEFECVHNEKMCHPGVYCDENGEIVFKSLDGKTKKFPDVTVDMIICMIKSIYRNIVMGIGESKYIKDAIDKFELVEPILKDSISRTFVKAWKERITDYESNPTTNIIEKCIGSIVESEGCKFVNCDVEGKKILYQNDEITVRGYNINGDYSSIRVDDMSDDKKSSVLVIQNIECDEPYIHIDFDFDDKESLMMEINNNDGIKYYTPSKKWISCYRICDIRQWVHPSSDDVRMFWNEQGQSGETFDLSEYGIENLIDKIYDSVKDDYGSPNFDRMFKLVRPVLFQAILRIGVKTVARLYSQVEYKREKVRELDNEIANSDQYNEMYIASCKSNRLKLLSKIEKLNNKIEDIQYNLYEESMRVNATIAKK